MHKNYLELAAKAAEAHLPDNHGFMLLTFPLGVEGRINYIANANREDCINALKEFLIRCGHKEDWLKHIE